MHKNNSIKCNVTNCRHNEKGCNCQLDSICVTCGCEGEDGNCTCCGSYSTK
ncbi:MAG: DUF1540 domain-containing protein [Clostridiales bacterium]|nr:DUF1540 domain-containing protein [Clostridiales bacterium]